MMDRYNVGIALNVLLVVLEVIALIQYWNANGSLNFIYYTIDSNIFVLIASVLYLITRKNVPKAVQLVKYSSALSVLITFLIVVFVLYPMSNFDFEFLFLKDSAFLLHVVCPVMATVSFLFFEKSSLDNSFKNNLRSLYFTIVYAIVLISLNILKVVSGPYPFLKVYEQPVFMTVLWLAGILAFAFILSRILMKLNEITRY
ncbi:hypothetical protein [uncultured Methanobrevibacter sp.]|uniref:hypothetical protein n=2 Tax=uncultured Methanobrevibacter sp. TaxID=253161 RepID=UPI0025E0A915|nr:hypothetical protein [uncultured Methanobrevibacter sp.]